MDYIGNRVIVSIYEIAIGLIVSVPVLWILKQKSIQFIQLFSLQLTLIAIGLLLLWQETEGTTLSSIAVVLIIVSFVTVVFSLLSSKSK